MQNTVKICVIGLGYVGLPLAVAFAKEYEVVGFDVKDKRIKELQQGIDRTREVSTEELNAVKIQYSSDPKDIKTCDFIVVAVPTPVTDSKTPDLTPLLKATTLIGQNMASGSTIIYESTVYPGATEEECIPVLEKESGLKSGQDFKVGYSPERINPGDKKHTINKITKVVSGMDEESLEHIANVYGRIIEAGVFKAASIKVAEAAKVIENTQRDLNIALMNELALIFEKMDIRTKDVLDAAGTKWNFLKFMPGLVGGHCIGVDPYYLTHKSLSLGYSPAMILSGRRINDSMGKEIAVKTVRQLVQVGKSIHGAQILVLGFTFKENIPDTRNTKVIDIVKELDEWDCRVDIYDPIADKEEALREYNIELIPEPQSEHYDAIILAVGHETFLSSHTVNIQKWFKSDPTKGVFVDVKSFFHKNDFAENILYWSL